MSYMTPYYFSSSIGQPLSIWMLSYDFAPKFGIALSGSTSLLTESFSGSAWQYSSSFAGAAVRYTTPSTAVYKVEATSIGATDTGSFKLYITAAETSSLVTTNIGTPWKLVYSPNADRIFSAEWVFTSATATSSLSILDPQTNTVVGTFPYYNTVMLDALYNSTTDTIFLWVSSSAGEFLDEYDGSGSALINSLPVTTSWAGDVNNKWGQMAYNSSTNQTILVPSTTQALSWSIYDFATATNVAYGLAVANNRGVVYASSTDYYYIIPFNDPASGATKVNGATYSSSVVTHMTGSGYGIAYISEIDRILYEDEVPSACAVYDPTTDGLVAKIPGVLDLQFAVFDTCKNCVVISDDAAGDPNYNDGGGLCYVATGSYLPLNFIHVYGAYSPIYCSSTSTVWISNYYNNDVQAIITSAGSGSLPQPPYPPTASATLAIPIELMVSSGSAVLDWSVSGSVLPDYYEVYRSTTGENGPYSVITTSLDTHSIDRNVTAINTYWYKVKGIALGGATSSFSNEAAIDIIPCNKAAFDPVVFSEYLSYSSGSTYNNIYGKVLNFTASTSQSISVWARSPDFATMLTLVDATGSILRTNQYDGWQPSGDLNVYGGSSALTYNLESGSYGIEISSVDNSVGRFTVVVSPGPKLETTWSGALETAYVSYISSSGWILVGENGANAVFYNPATGQQKKITPNAGCQGALYSPIQDKCYLWVYYQTGGQYTASIDVYDNTGSYLNSNYFFRSPVNTFPNVDFSGYFCYDGKNDRLAFHRYFTATTQSFVVWDCATETIIAGPINMMPYNPTFGSAWQSCYSWIDNSYYVALTRSSPFYANPQMVKVDAATFAITNSLSTNSILVSYVSQSNLLIGRGGAGSNATGPSGGPVQFIDPVLDTVVYTSPDLPSDGQLFEGGSAGDKCANTYVMSIDPRSGWNDVTNHPCLAVMDRNTHLPMNYLKINDDSSDPGGFAPDGWYTYNIVSVDETSKVYLAQVEYDNNVARLYSIIPTRAFMPILSPYTSSASDTASCMTFDTQFRITASGVTRATADYVCSSKMTGSSVIDTMVVSDFEINGTADGYHNFNNHFLKSDGTYYRNYTSSYIHTYSGKNSVFCNGKFYMMSDDVTEQSGNYLPVSASSMLVFDQTGSLLTTIPLTYGGRDWATDGFYVYVYEIDTPTSGCYLETIESETDTIYTAADQLQIGYVTTPGFAFTYATASATASAPGLQFENQVPNFGRIVAFADNQGDTFIYFNDIYGNNALPNGTDTFLDTGSGDRIWAGGSSGTALYNYATKLNMGQGSAYTRWCGSAQYCPITDHVYWGAVDLNDNAVLIETDKNLNFVNTHSVERPIHSIVWNRTNRTLDLFSNEVSSGRMYIFDVVANTIVCSITTLTAGGITTGQMGYNIDVNVKNGDVYVPQRQDGASSPATGSIKIFQV